MVLVCAVWLTLFLASTSVQAKAPLHRAPESFKRKDKNNCFIVRLKDDTPDDAHQRLFEEMYGDSESAVFFDKVFRGFGKCNGKLEQMEVFTENSFVAEVAEDQVVKVHTVQDTSVNPARWNLDRIDQHPTAPNNQYNYEHTGRGVTVYIVDTGVQSNHVDFGARVQDGKSTVNGNPKIDCHGHGTHVAGIAAGTVSGVAKDANIVPVQVIGCTGAGSDITVSQGLDWILSQLVQPKPAVINLSIGGPTSSLMNVALTNVIGAGYIVVASAGNEVADACQYSPAGHSDVFTVGSTEQMDNWASYSNFGSCVDLLAPGSWVYSADASGTNGWKAMSGTSMSSPLVAGVAATYLEANPEMNQAALAKVPRAAATKNIVNNVPAGTPNYLLYAGAAESPTPTPTPTALPICTLRKQVNCIPATSNARGGNRGRRAGPADTAPPTAETPSRRSPTLLWFGVSLAGLLAALALFPRRHISDTVAPLPELLEEIPNSPPPQQQPSVCVAVKPHNEQVTEPRVRRASQFAL